MTKTITAYKGFKKDLKCRDYQFEIGKTFTHGGPVVKCESGFHASEYPLDVLQFYAPADSVFAQVEQSGTLDSDDTKTASSVITIKAQLSVGDLVKAAIDFTMTKIKKERENDKEAKTVSNTGDYGASSNTGVRGASSNTGYSGASSNTGDYGASSNTGDYGASSNTGVRGASSNTGDYGASSNTGYSGASSNTGVRGASSNTGDYGASSNTGYSGASSNTGYSGASSNTGDYGASSNTGDYGASSNTGVRGASSNTGDYGASSNTGDYGASSNTGYSGAAFSNAWGGSAETNAEKGEGIAVSIGYQARAKAAKGGWLVLALKDDEGRVLHVASAQAGKTKGVKPDVWYTLNAKGKFAEWKP